MTLVELMVAVALGSMLMGWVGLAFMALQRSFEAANYQMTAQNDQLRVLDYISRDLRTAATVTVSSGNGKVTVTLPTDNTSTLGLKLGPLLDPLLSTAASAVPMTTVAYYVEGGQLIREVNKVQNVIADTVDNVQFTPSGSYVTTDVVFTSRFSSSPTTASQPNIHASNCTFLRNATPTN